jgi:hypothetical protein
MADTQLQTFRSQARTYINLQSQHPDQPTTTLQYPVHLDVLRTSEAETLLGPLTGDLQNLCSLAKELVLGDEAA